jgi:hypothetical protein
MDEIRQAAARFRKAIIVSGGGDHIVFRDFPRGSCGDTSILLGEYLSELGYGEWSYVPGVRGRSTHAWIEQRGVIVDITADQFEDMDEPVIVTTSRDWHGQFRVDAGEVNIARIHVYDPHTQRTLTEVYAAVHAAVRVSA